jgi:hypothetical protein
MVIEKQKYRILSSIVCPFFIENYAEILPAHRVTRLGEISPFGECFMALGEFLSRKNCPMIWAKF